MTKNDIEIIHEHDDFLVINKPVGVSVSADRSGRPDILSILRRQLPNQPKLLLVHRLDKDTSGVMLIAKSTDWQRRLCGLFAKRVVKKTYLVIVAGPVTRKEGLIDLAIARSRKDSQLMIISSGRAAKPAVTGWQLLADFGSAALFAVWPATGRTHQIRIHLAAAAMPLYIDPLYGTAGTLLLSNFKQNYQPKKSAPERSLIDRLTLHAYQIEIPSEDGSSSGFVARLERKFAAALKMLIKHNPKGRRALTEPEKIDAIMNGRPV